MANLEVNYYDKDIINKYLDWYKQENNKKEETVMTKSETVNSFLELSKKMSFMLDQCNIDFNKECNAIIGLTKENINKFSIVYNIDKHNVLLVYKVENPTLLNVTNHSETVNVSFAEIDFVSETITKTDYENYLNIVDLVLDTFDKEKITLEKEKSILYNKSNNFWFRLTHPRVGTAIKNIDSALNQLNQYESDIVKEKDLLANKTIIDDIFKTFVDEVGHTYGLMNLKYSNNKGW
jgi:predicted Zn-dependent protease